MLTPISLLFCLILGFISLAVPVLGFALTYIALRGSNRPVRVRRNRVYGRRTETDEVPVRTATRWPDRLRNPEVSLPLIAGLCLMVFTLFRRHLVRLAFPSGTDEPAALRGTPSDIMRPDGTRIHVETFGPSEAPALVLTHGWSTDN